MAMFETSMTALHGWHKGEVELQTALNLAEHVRFDYTLVRDHMPSQHRIFHASNIAFVPFTTLDSDGRPWVSLLSSNAGTAGFITGPSEVELRIDADVWEGDPITRNIDNFKHPFIEGGPLVAGLGIEWASRRRNKFAGQLYEAKATGNHLYLGLRVTQTLGNCPKYISIRTVAPAVTAPKLIYDQPNMASDARLPDDVINFIHKCDGIFLGTSYVAPADQQSQYPSHVGTNHRGGKPGFVRVRNDKRTVVLPDYSGNRFMNSLGNVQITPIAGLTILDFETGDILYMTGQAHNAIGEEAQEIMPRMNLVTLVSVTGYSFVRNAMPVRQVPGSAVIPSPYSPPVRYLAEESLAKSTSSSTSLTLARIQIHSHDLATFSFTPSAPIRIRPGQTAIIDTLGFTGPRSYQHMARGGQEASLNDDGVRTWTVSGRSVPDDDSSEVMITMREKPGGFVTGRLFEITRKIAQAMPGLLEDASPLQMKLELVGIDGDFVLPVVEAGDLAITPMRLLWAAGGVGITPFLSMLRGIMHSGGHWDAVLLLASRRGDVEVFGQLIADALRLGTTNESRPRPTLSLRVVVFSKDFNADRALDFGSLPDGSPVPVSVHSERLSKADLTTEVVDAVGREVFVCGPLPMEELVIQGVQELGTNSESVRRENFAY